MKRKRWQSSSLDSSPSPSFPSWQRPTTKKIASSSHPPTSSVSSSFSNFSNIPSDILNEIAAPFNSRDLKSALTVCKSWRDALQPLRQAMLSVMLGKRFKEGTHGVQRDLNKALDCFLKGGTLGSTLSMIDAGVLYSELGKEDEEIAMYTRAGVLADPARQCNLAITLLTDDPANPKEALRWLHKASEGGCARAQHQLAVCLQKGHGVYPNRAEAAKWYMRAAENGYAQAMYDTSLCYSYEKGLPYIRWHAEKWVTQAANCGHSRAQYEHGLALYRWGDMFNAAVFLELATRAGEKDAANIRDAALRKLSTSRRALVLTQVDSWRPLGHLQSCTYS